MGIVTKAEGGLRRGFVWVSGAFFSLFLFVMVIALSYQLGAKERGGEELLTVRAAEGPFKVPPADGGQSGTVPYQDIGVYNRLEAEGEQTAGLQNTQEQILPPPEEPAVASDGLPRILDQPDELREAANEGTIASSISEIIARESYKNATGDSSKKFDEETARIMKAAKEASDEASALLEDLRAKTDAAADGTEQQVAAVSAETKEPEEPIMAVKKVEPVKAAEPVAVEPVEVAKAELNTSEMSVEDLLKAAAEAVKEPEAEPEVIAAKPTQPVAVKKPAPVKKAAPAKKVAAKKVAPKKEPEVDVAALAPKPIPAGKFVVQLGAFREQAVAESEWRKIARANKDILGTMSPNIVKADIPKKGIYYRLRVGPMDNRASASSLCKLLGKRKQPCLVTKS